MPVKLFTYFLASGTAVALASVGSHRALVGEADRAFQAEVQHMELQRTRTVAALESNMTFPGAFELLRKNPKATPELLSMVKQMHPMPKGNSHKDGFLGLAQTQPATGYAGLDKARDMLNEMLDEVNQKHDSETMRCKDFFNSQCALMEITRQDIAAANAAASDARSRILAAQKEINYCEIQLPRLRHDLWENERVCHARITDLEESLSIVLADIEVMVSVLKMTDCNNVDDAKSSFIQVTDLRLVKCECATESVVHMHNKELRKSLSQIKSDGLKKSVMGALKDLDDQSGEPPLGFETASNATNFTNPPLPQTDMPSNPCKGIGYRRPYDGSKCSLASNPMCYKLQERFLNIQSGIEDTRDTLMSELDDTKTRCRITKETLESEIEALESHFSSEQEKLATGVSDENTAGETGRQKGEEHHNLAHDMFSTREGCSSNLETFESEQCALKKIRGELYKVKGDEHPAFFQDCEVSGWEPEECSVTCGGGVETLVRSVTVQPFKGAACPPLFAKQGCSLEDCPVDCEVADWSGWSSCSADCDGGVMTRNRAVDTQPKSGGEPCGETTQSENCNPQACSKNCDLHDWTPWANCSKACSGGVSIRKRAVAEPEVGAGTCPPEVCPPEANGMCERHEEKECNDAACPKKNPDLALPCEQPVDIILLLDGSGSIGQDGFDAEKKFAETVVGAFEPHAAKFSIIVFSGPRTWSEYYACFSDPNVDLKATCGINKVQDFSEDLAGTQDAIKALEWPTGTTFTSVALQTAVTELSLSRPEAPAIVIVVTDGTPLSPRKTEAAAKEVRDAGARLIMVPVQGRGLTDASRDWMLTMASEPKEDNFLPLDDIERLKDIASVDKLVASACPVIDLMELPPQCEAWCANLAGENGWAHQCTQLNLCAGCTECAVQGLCADWCANMPGAWTQKCTYKKCGGCGDCR